MAKEKTNLKYNNTFPKIEYRTLKTLQDIFHDGT